MIGTYQLCSEDVQGCTGLSPAELGLLSVLWLRLWNLVLAVMIPIGEQASMRETSDNLSKLDQNPHRRHPYLKPALQGDHLWSYSCSSAGCCVEKHE
jgi:hypothetical protein